jgi:hypothetical protein
MRPNDLRFYPIVDAIAKASYRRCLGLICSLVLDSQAPPGSPAVELLSYLDDQRAGGVELIAVDPVAVGQMTRYGSLADAIDAIRRGVKWKVASPG